MSMVYNNRLIRHTQMEPYHNLLREVMETGVPQFNDRTQKTCIMIPGSMMKFDLRQGFPAVTTKKMYFEQPVGELIGFMRGYTSAEDFRKVGCKWWDANANQNAAWLANPTRKGEDDLGPIYGKQWTDWAAYREYERGANGVAAARMEGWEMHGEFWPMNGLPQIIMRKNINQLEQCLHAILHDPSNRRILFHAWNPADFGLMALPPCHVLYQFIADQKNNTLHMLMYQRSH